MKTTTALIAATAAIAALAPSLATAGPPSAKDRAARSVARAIAGTTPNTVTVTRGSNRVRVVRSGRRITTALIDRNHDGTFDSGLVDVDRDGRWDFHWDDTDRDGRLDRREIRRIKRAPRAATTIPAQKAPVPAGPQGACAQGQATCANLDVTADIDGDGENETTKGDPDLYSGGSYGQNTDADGDVDEVVVGTRGGAKPTGTGNLDNDPRDTELIVEDPTLPVGQFHAIDIDRDGDADVIVVGTGTGPNPPAQGAGSGNVDNDPNDTELIFSDPMLPVGQTITIDVDRDGDVDVIFVGTAGGAEVGGTDDLDGSPGDREIVVYDPNLAQGQSIDVDLDRDGDPDLVIRGTK